MRARCVLAMVPRASVEERGVEVEHGGHIARGGEVGGEAEDVAADSGCLEDLYEWHCAYSLPARTEGAPPSQSPMIRVWPMLVNSCLCSSR